jgi:hypothetical protein
MADDPYKKDRLCELTIVISQTVQEWLDAKAPLTGGDHA